MSFTASPLDAATNVNQATGTAATIQTGDVVTGTTGSADKLTITGAVGTSGAFYAIAAGVTNFEQIVLDNTSNYITMPTALVATAANNSINVVTGGTGYDVIGLTAGAAQAMNMTTVTGIEQINFGANAQTVTTSGAAASGLFNTLAFTTPTVTMGNFLNNITLTNSGAAVVVVNGGTSNDTVTLANTVAATSVTFNGVETVNAANSGVLDVVIFGGATAVNFTAGSAGSNVQGSTASDTITLKTTGTGADTIVATATFSNISAIDTVANFNAVGNDVFNTGVAATTLTNLTIASADTAGLAAAIATAATAAGATLAANTQAYYITVNAGTAAGTYALQNLGADAAVTAADFLVKLTGTIGAITTADFA